jgi:hypothetical protein
MDLFSFLSFHFMCVTVTVVTGHSVALSRHSHLFSTMSSLHDVIFARCISAQQLLGSAPWRRCLCRTGLMEYGGPWKY